MQSQFGLIPLVSIGLLVLSNPGQAQTTTAPAAPKDGLRVVHVGNSHSHPLRMVEPFAWAVGHTAHKNGEINILGAPLRWNWDHPEQNKWKETLDPKNQWDAITLLSWGGDDDKYAPLFTAEALKGNSRCQVFIYTIWPDAHMDFEKPDPIRTEAHTEAVAAAVAKACPDIPKPRVIPSSLLIREMGRLADRGELPGVATRFELYADGGHLSEYAQYAINVLVTAMLYNECPLNYPTSIYRNRDASGKGIKSPYGSLEVPAPTAEIIKRLAWDILQTYPPAGMKPGLVLADRRLPPAIVGQPYTYPLKALNADRKAVFSVVKGELPKGLTLTPEGQLSGTVAATGSFPLTLKVADNKASFERPVTLEVNQDLPPSIAEVKLPEITLDRHLLQPLKATGGVGHLTWSLADGKLPYGIMLSPAGVLRGSPGEAGTFTFKIKVEDAHPAGPRAAEKSFTWTIAPASPEALLVKKVGEKEVTLDGKASELFWTFEQPIAKKAGGNPTKKASFSAVWVAKDKSRNPGEGAALVLAVKVLDGPAGKTNRDAIHVYIDGRHDRLAIYDADDTHFRITRDGKVTSVRGKPNWFVNTKTSEIDGGYVMEINLSSNYFVGEGNWLRFGNQGVYGFDLAVEEGEKEPALLTWHGTEKDPDDTTPFGTIVLTDTPAAGGEKK